MFAMQYKHTIQSLTLLTHCLRVK